jgi:hypothetical protein
MFLLATLVLNYLSANFFYSGEEFMRAIDTLPRELTALYVLFLPMAQIKHYFTDANGAQLSSAMRNYSLGSCPTSTPAPPST